MNQALAFLVFVVLAVLIGIALVAGMVFSAFAFRGDVSPTQAQPSPRSDGRII
jgi:flagellar basal body-associated protein FliL